MLPTNLAQNNPPEADVEGDTSDECTTYDFGFSDTCWGWDPERTVSDGYAYAWRFQLADDRDKYEDQSTMTVWGVVSQSGSDNVRNDITLTGAISLNFVAASVAAGALVALI